MLFRKIISLSILISFIALFVTGVLSYVQPYTRLTASMHTVFGTIFSLGVLFHFANNLKPLKRYSSFLMLLPIIIGAILIGSAVFFDAKPIQKFMDFGTALKAKSKQKIDEENYEYIQMDGPGETQLSIDLLRGVHYWHPQMAIWIEDTNGKYIETLFVSKATAQGLFFGGRSKDNFKSFDGDKSVEHSSSSMRRVNALPIWSFKRGEIYEDGLPVPTEDHPLPDAISGATISDNFKMKANTTAIDSFIVNIEINVAFDDNEFYSEFDFPDDEVYHSGTGQLGQPSIIYQAQINQGDGADYYLMELVGHGHHSAQHGDIIAELSTLTTAHEIVERIVIGVKSQSEPVL